MTPLESNGSWLGLSRRKVLLGLAFGSAAAAASLIEPTKRWDVLGKRQLKDLVPEEIGPWRFVTQSGLVVPPKDELADLLYSQLLTRVYSDGSSPPIMLLIAQSAEQTGILQVHRPEVCYPAGGYTLSPTTQHSTKIGNKPIKLSNLTASADNFHEQILYWTRVGRHQPSTWLEQRWAVAQDNLSGIVPDAVMVRISMISPEKEAALTPLTRFIQSFAAAIPPQARSVFFA